MTSHGAGLSVPDWPNSYGYNMFAFPVSMWRGGIFYEHTHRLMGTVVGFCSVLLALRAWGAGRNPAVRRFLWIGATLAVLIAVLCGAMLPFVPAGERGEKLHGALNQSLIGWAGMALVLACATLMRQREPRRWARWLATGVLGAVLFQGLLGGLRVVLVNLDLAIVHACVAQAFFCLAALTAVVTSKWWYQAPDLSRAADAPAGRRLIVAGVVAFVAIYAQLMVGATMRHYQAGLAVPDLPLAYGQVIPATDAASLDKINEYRTWQLQLPRVTAGQIWLHMGHRLGAVVVTLALSWLITQTLRRDRGVSVLHVLAAFATTVLGLGLLGVAHAVGSTHYYAEGVGSGLKFFVPAVAFIVATVVLLRRARTPMRLVPPAILLAGLLVIQITLGVLTVLYRKPADVASAHVAVGALTLLTTFVLTVRSIRLYRAGVARRAAAETEETESPQSAPSAGLAAA